MKSEIAADAQKRRRDPAERVSIAAADQTNKAGEVSSKASAADIRAFRRNVLNYWKKEGRHSLPWRTTHDAYKILVSEVMLQQTQVPRVIEKYKEFLREFPTLYMLAQASLAEVLRAWSGLGYNRRGKYLHDAAKLIANRYRGSIKDATEGKLPGIGPYTRAAVRVFAYDEPHTLLETNVRAAFIHHFFAEKESVNDRDLVPLMEAAAADQDPRQWHWALMDYGTYIKKLHKNPARKSASYVRQSKFEGSLRQVRGAVLQQLHKGPRETFQGYEWDRIKAALATLEKDGLIIQKKGKWRIA
jgi:A/G-specific adenine glycosylase